ncbi:phage shock protein PspA [Erythrobacter tepidarius]|uniref:phage shock protein PspA n=1 Tax=Erythrobacter tepidarius TaxID=60454 RepID=UPI003CCBA726
MGDPFDPLGPERPARDAPPADAAGDARPERVEPGSDAPAQPSRLLSSGRLSRLDEEIEALRRSPTPTQSRGRTNPQQQERVAPLDRVNSFLDGVAFMGIFSRTRDIIAANFNDMLDKADDPSKMIRMIILEMEETLVEVRASAARTIADQKEMHRHCVKLERLQADWAEKAQLALSKDREDLARAALVEKKKAADMAEQLKAEIAVLDDALRAYEDDIQKLQHRLREARSRQTAIAARLESAENRVKLRTLLSTERTDEALARFDQLERRVDYAEGRADALQIAEGKTPSLADEIAALAGSDAIDDELEAMKKALGKSGEKKGE